MYSRSHQSCTIEQNFSIILIYILYLLFLLKAHADTLKRDIGSSKWYQGTFVANGRPGYLEEPREVLAAADML